MIINGKLYLFREYLLDIQLYVGDTHTKPDLYSFKKKDL
jgi:hypothetical protein